MSQRRKPFGSLTNFETAAAQNVAPKSAIKTPKSAAGGTSGKSRRVSFYKQANSGPLLAAAETPAEESPAAQAPPVVAAAATATPSAAPTVASFFMPAQAQVPQEEEEEEEEDPPVPAFPGLVEMQQTPHLASLSARVTDRRSRLKSRAGTGRQVKARVFQLTLKLVPPTPPQQEPDADEPAHAFSNADTESMEITEVGGGGGASSTLA